MNQTNETTQTIGQARLLKLAEYLRTIPVEAFDMDEWTCGTTACAVGHAATLFKSEGFTLTYNLWRGSYHPYYHSLTGWTAVTAFFHITSKAVDYLFENMAYDRPPTPNEVADRLVEFVKSNGQIG